MTKSVIFYTDNLLDETLPHVAGIVQEQLRKSFDGEIITCSLKPMLFGDRHVILENRVRSYPTMCKQILMALEAATTDIVYFCENDVLYNKHHFTHEPSSKEIYCYNVNNWRWRWPNGPAITYDGLNSLSMLCCYRETAIPHYEYRLKLIAEQSLDDGCGREPRWARRFGYEPGTKPTRRGGITDEPFERWRSELPMVDIRHRGTFTRSKITLEEFKHPPTNWVEIATEYIPGWDLKELFDIK